MDIVHSSRMCCLIVLCLTITIGIVKSESTDSNIVETIGDETTPVNEVSTVNNVSEAAGGQVIFHESNVPNKNINDLGNILKSKVKMLQADGNRKVDVVFLIDASSSVGQENFNSELKFVKKLLADFSISINETRVAVITFSDQDRVVRHIDHISIPSEEFHKCNMLHDDLPNIKYVGGLTYTLGALVEAQSVLEWSRPGAQKAIFLVTDGFSNGGDPVPVAQILKDNGTLIFTFGIQSGNIMELGSIASPPPEEFSFLLDSFDQFEAMVRRALHQDLTLGSYQLLHESIPCDSLCSGSEASMGAKGCCDTQAHCACGTASGHYRCLCNPGYYGTGIRGSCTPCPNGTYHDGQIPGDDTVCQLCPDPNHITVMGEASSKNSCICKRGFTARGFLCEVITCPHIYPPENGYFVKGHGMCPNVFNAACGIRCKAGYTLHGSSIRLCQEDGTWSGKAPKCVVKMCPNPEVPFNGDVKCSLEPSLSNDFLDSVSESTKVLVSQYAVDTECEFSCQPGHIMIGSRRRMCLPLARWDGLRTVCKPVTCSPLPKVLHGSVTPTDCVDSVKVPFGNICTITCDNGYKLVGPSSRKCGGRGGQWSLKSSSSKCIDEQPPNIICPSDIEVETDPGEAFSSVRIPQPIATDNSGKLPMIWSQPAVTVPIKIPIGMIQITYIAMDQSHNQASCNLTVTVIDKEPPVIESCLSPHPIHLMETDGNRTVSWTDPVFWDNSGKRPHVNVSHSYGEFPIGKTEVIATAFDEFGNNSTCVLEVIVEDSPCSGQPPNLKHALLICNGAEEGLSNCSMTCHEGYAVDPSLLVGSKNFYMSDNGSLYFTCPSLKQEMTNLSTWQTSVLPECSETVLPNSVSQEGVVSLIANHGACEDHALLEKVKMLVDQELFKQSEDFCRNVSNFECRIFNSNSTCEEIASVAEEETNVIHHRKRSTLQFKPNRQRSRRDTFVSSQHSSNINVHFKLQTDAKKSENFGAVVGVTNDFSQLKDSLSMASIDLPSNVKGEALSWRGNAPDLICPDGSIAHSSGICLKCSSGYFFSMLLRKCLPCPVGKYQNLEGQTGCRSCSRGMSTKHKGSRSERDCLYICRPGSFGRIHSSTDMSVSPCSVCPSGSYQSSYGASSCLPCPPGSRPLKRGAKTIEDCFISSKGNVSLSADCQHNPCENGGICQTMSLGFVSCDCPHGFYGPSCEIEFDHCNSNPCLHGGDCRKKNPSGYTCTCPPGYHGLNCEEEDDECSSNPCLNNSTCEDLYAGYYCDCPDGYQGLKCEINTNDCLNNPCGDHGLCVDGISNYTCSCVDDYTGRHCENYPLNPCLEMSPCSNGGSCIILSNTLYRCLCPFGWEGEQCERKIQDSCIPSPCLNGGTCIRGVGHKYFCHCHTYFTGNICQTSLESDFVLHLNSPGVTDYAIIDLPPQNLTEITACLWLQSKDGLNYGTAFSYATTFQFNSFTLTDYNGFVLYVNGESVVTDVSANDGLWHHVCIQWQSHQGLWNIYLDGSLRDNGLGLSANSAVYGGGKFVLGQEQDSVGGSFNEAESLIGRIYRLDLWDYFLDPKKIHDIANECHTNFHGSLVNWSDFLPKLQGEVKVENSTFCLECPPPEQLWRGSVVLTKAGRRTVASYVCDNGFVLRGSKSKRMERQCLKQGSWEGITPVCVRLSCGFPGYLPGGTFQGRSFFFNDTVKYMCNFGAKVIGNATRVCEANGTWSGKQPICKGLECQSLNPPRNGTITLSEKTNGVKVATFLCNDGFHVDGAPVLTCMYDGTWDEAIPDCLLNECPEPPQIEHGSFGNRSMKSFMFMDTLHFECEPGYEVYPRDSDKLYCAKDGTWDPYNSNFSLNTNNKFPKCKPSYCLEPDILDHGSWSLGAGFVVDHDHYTSGSALIATCESDYEVVGPKTKHCQEKAWLPLDITQCSKITCDTEELPVSLPHSIIHLSGEEVGNSATLTCKDGYQLSYAIEDPAISLNVATHVVTNGSRVWICNRNGSWIMNENYDSLSNNETEWLACLPNNHDSNPSTPVSVSCNQPQAPAFGYINTDNLSISSSEGTIIEVQCRPGFVLDGIPNAVCGRNGSWIGLPAQCKPVTCHAPLHYPNMILASSTAVGRDPEFGNLLTYICLPGFFRHGDLSIRCQSNGTWSRMRGKCSTY